MKVAIIISRLAQLGPVFLIQTLANSLKNFEDVSIKVFFLDKEVDPEMKMSAQVEQYSPQSLCFSDYDIIHTHGLRPDLIAFVNRRKIRYHVSTIHNFVFEDLNFSYNRLISKIFGNIWLRLWRKADKLVCITGTMKNYYENWFAPAKLDLIYNGIPDLETSSLSVGNILHSIDHYTSQGLKVIGCAGVLNKGKGFDQVIRLIHKESAFALVIFGDGKARSTLEGLTNELNIKERCTFAGFTSGAVNYFRYLDLIIIPSRSEGFGLVLVEAVQQKVPVICSDIPVFRELFSEDEITFFKLDDSKSLIDAITISEKEGKRKSELAYRRYLNNYTAEKMANAYYMLYRSVADQSFSSLSPEP